LFTTHPPTSFPFGRPPCLFAEISSPPWRLSSTETGSPADPTSTRNTLFQTPSENALFPPTWFPPPACVSQLCFFFFSLFPPPPISLHVPSTASGSPFSACTFILPADGEGCSFFLRGSEFFAPSRLWVRPRTSPQQGSFFPGAHP